MKFITTFPIRYFLKFILIQIILISTTPSFCQIKTRYYLDEYELFCFKENATHFALVDYDSLSKNYHFVKYTMDSVLIKRASYKDSMLHEATGSLIVYFPNGKKKYAANYKENYSSDVAKWYSNGNIMETGFITKEKKYYMSTFYDSLGNQLVKDGDGIITNYLVEDKRAYSETGNIKDGLKEGEWKGYYKNSKTYFDEFYKEGKLTSGVSFDTAGTIYKYYSYEYYACVDHLTEFLKLNVKYPTEAREKKIHGINYISFTINKDGNITSCKPWKTVSPLFYKEIVRVVTQYKSPENCLHRRGQIVDKLLLTQPLNFRMP